LVLFSSQTIYLPHIVPVLNRTINGTLPETITLEKMALTYSPSTAVMALCGFRHWVAYNTLIREGNMTNPRLDWPFIAVLATAAVAMAAYYGRWML